MKGVFQATAASSGKRPKDKREMVAGSGVERRRERVREGKEKGERKRSEKGAKGGMIEKNSYICLFET